eukprot:scaffold11.g4079.t1
MDGRAPGVSASSGRAALRVEQRDPDWLSADAAGLLVGGLDISFLPPCANGAAASAPRAAAGAAEASAAPSGAGAATRSKGASPRAELGGARAAPERAVTGLVVLRCPGLEEVYADCLEVELHAPYAPGFLGFQRACSLSCLFSAAFFQLGAGATGAEVPAFQRLLQRARERGSLPQLLFVDGFGVLHPRRCGSASQLGVECGLPTVEGLARHDVLEAVHHLQQQQAQEHARQAEEERAPAGEGGERRCQATELLPHSDQRSGHGDGGTSMPHSTARTSVPGAAADVASPLPLAARSGEVLGAAVCPNSTRRPIVVSVGHHVSLATAVALTLRCCRHRRGRLEQGRDWGGGARSFLFPFSPMRRPGRVTFAPTPSEELAAAMGATAGTALLWALFWPVLLPWKLAIAACRLPQAAEAWLAAPLGAAIGLAQGGAFAAAAIAQLVLGRGGLQHILHGKRLLAHRTASVPVPGTPPSLEVDTSANRMASSDLHATVLAALAATEARAPPAEPALHTEVSASSVVELEKAGAPAPAADVATEALRGAGSAAAASSAGAKARAEGRSAVGALEPTGPSASAAADLASDGSLAAEVEDAIEVTAHTRRAWAG